MGINFSGITTKINVHGTTVSILSYSGTTDQYDEDQEPIVSTTGTSRVALVLEPSTRDIEHNGGLVSSFTKKFIFPQDFKSITVSDELYLDGTFVSILVEKKITRTIVFANRRYVGT